MRALWIDAGVDADWPRAKAYKMTAFFSATRRRTSAAGSLTGFAPVPLGRVRIYAAAAPSAALLGFAYLAALLIVKVLT